LLPSLRWRSCAGGPLGSGKQWVSWIHRDDLVDLIIDAIRSPSYTGVFNGTAPKPVTMAQLCSSVGGVMGRPSWLPVPDFAITTLLGEGAQVSERRGVHGAVSCGVLAWPAQTSTPPPPRVLAAVPPNSQRHRNQVVLEGQKVLPTRAQQVGFKFKYTELSDALRNILT
jgi:NAD dependent epimerase/dehydratase family enzyme